MSDNPLYNILPVNTTTDYGGRGWTYRYNRGPTPTPTFPEYLAEWRSVASSDVVCEHEIECDEYDGCHYDCDFSIRAGRLRHIEVRMNRDHPLEYLVWKQEQEDERMSQESTVCVTSSEEGI